MDKEKVNDPYAGLGVSSKKEGVHKAIKNLSKGLYPGAFCQIVSVGSSLPKEIQDNYVQILHSDGVGTKSNVAYIAMREGFGYQILKTLPQDAVVMNTDDMACVGVTNDIYISNHIARNANRVNDEALGEIIGGYSDLFNKMETLGIHLYNAGGETADVGSYTTTMGIDVTASSIIPKSEVIDCNNIKENQYIVGLASYGKAKYEDRENSGIRSNGLTLAINTLLHPDYRKYKEVMDQTVPEDNLFVGKYHLEDKLKGTNLKVVDAILSPTRTYLPVLNKLKEEKVKIYGIIHCSGGGLTKSINFGNNIAYIKDGINKFETPAIFKEIQEIRNISDYNMYQTFNMGIGMEIIVDTEDDANKIIEVSNGFNIDAKIIGHTEKTNQGNLVKINNDSKLVYSK